ncbi:MAG TPA: CpXC domain-containing protein [Methanocorpusculum sp.]|nr:CpXC domain-containing protein [Methanocorpusculum sp.]HJJ90814.1 CpXC domain-containing protein [Methanocorpusculum sp.]HJK01123.1 CpXC domain-containing protein [Methanocorpusculum sp.]
MNTKEDLVICPSCDHEQMNTIFPSVDVSKEKEMREMILSCKLFQFTCDGCSYTYFSGYPSVYEDKETFGGSQIYLKSDGTDQEISIDRGCGGCA